MVLITGLVVVALMLSGAKLLPEQHPMRRWAADFLSRRGPVETARLAGVVLLMLVLGTLTLWHA
ncbi:hypothetical protein CBY09_03065 [Acidovorax kalamii]|uniref:Uncharacterized protein n=2 Tax=Acidovorax kalamii TaxID=2004485 RepID=A0A235ES34_9BURK|nr:hypothetical protein CBY09_03065 [Acidovorax kalamii]